MKAGIEIPFHEAIVFDLDSAGADRFLEQHSPSIFFIGEQFVDCFPIPFGLASGGRNTLLFQPGSNFPQTVTSKIPFKYPTHHLGFVRIYFQLSIRIDRVHTPDQQLHLHGILAPPSRKGAPLHESKERDLYNWRSTGNCDYINWRSHHAKLSGDLETG